MQASRNRSAGRFWSAGAALLLAVVASWALLIGCTRPGPSTTGPGATTTDGESQSDGNGDSAHGDGYGHGKGPVDPVIANGKIFESWPTPRLAIVVTGQQQGYLEPCGCAGLDNQLGGLGRRHGMLKKLAADGWPMLAVDVGGQVRRFGRQPEIKFQTTVDALKTMGYSAVALGEADLRLPAEELVAVVSNTEEVPSPFVAANIAPFGFDAALVSKYRVVEAGGLRVGITAVLGDAERAGLDPAQIEHRAAADAIGEVLDEMRDETDFRILLVHGTRDESLELGKQFPEFDLVVTSGGADTPPDRPTMIDDDTWLVEVGHKGMYAAVVGLFAESGEAPRYQRVPLDSRFPASDEMAALMTGYQDQLRELGFAGLGLTPATHPRGTSDDPQAGEFASVDTCKECHKKAYDTWSKTNHAHATETLAKLNPPRQFDPECISCHATGWNPQEHFQYATGFESLDTTPQLAGNSCENCHGPGAAHVAAEQARGAARDLARRDALRVAMRLTKATADEQVCANCHDVDNSPEFKFDRYWPKVEHKGKD